MANKIPTDTQKWRSVLDNTIETTDPNKASRDNPTDPKYQQWEFVRTLTFTDPV